MDIINLKISAGVRYRDKIYFSELYMNGLFSLDINSKKISFLKNFAEEKNNFMLFRNAYLYKNIAWFLPWRSRFIVKVNLDTLEMKYFEIPFQKINRKAEQELNIAFLSTGVIGKKYLYLVPVNYDMVLLIDMENEKIVTYEKAINIEKNIYTLGTVVDKVLWMIPYKGRQIAKLNLETGQIEYDEWKYEAHSFTGIEAVDGILWCSPDEEKDLIGISINSLKESRIAIPEILKEDLKFNIVCHEGEMWLLPSKARRLISVNIETHLCKEWSLKDGVDATEQYGIRKLYVEQGELAFSTTKTVLLFETEKRKFISIPLKMKKNEFLETLEKGNECMTYCGSERIVEEYIGINFFVRRLLNIQNKSEACIKKHGNIIWNLIREM